MSKNYSNEPDMGSGKLGVALENLTSKLLGIHIKKLFLNFYRI